MKSSYLGVACLANITPIALGDIVDSVFIEITNADSKDGFLLEYEGIEKLYSELMARTDGSDYNFETRNQKINIVINHGLTELTITAKEAWKSETCKDIKELEEGLQVGLADFTRMLVPTQVLIKRLFNIITAKERGLFNF